MKGLSTEAINIILASLTDSSIRQYETPLKTWWQFAYDNGLKVYEYNMGGIIEFLTEQFQRGIGYGSINSYR